MPNPGWPQTSAVLKTPNPSRLPLGLPNVYVVTLFAPAVAITAPASGAVKSGNVAITATAADATAGIRDVTFRAKPSGAAGFSDIGVDSSAGPGGTYAISWPTAGLPDGLADIQVVARDWAGNQMGDTLTIVLDNNAPTVTVSAPGGALSGDVTLTATASGDVLEVDTDLLVPNELQPRGELDDARLETAGRLIWESRVPFVAGSSGVEYALARAHAYAQAAKRDLEAFPPSEERDVLSLVADFVVDRDR